MDDTDLGPPVLVWRDDPLFNQGHVAAELAIAAFRELKTGEVWEESSAEDATERLEAFLTAARAEAAESAKAWTAQVDRNPKGHDPAEGRGRNDESPVAATSGDAPKLCPKGSTHG